MSRKLSSEIRKNKPYKLQHIPKVQVLAEVNGRTKMIMLLIQEGNGKAMTTTTQMAINRSLQTSRKLNVFDVTGTHQNLWYIDTGCSNHMCGDKSAFSDLDETFCNSVTFGDNSKVSVMGKGSVRIHSKEKSNQIISNVFFVPDLKTNLLSVGQVQEKGYEIFIKDGVCRI
ncbi:uncharacterized protein LOC116122419 [Pistacia vera]|uniref:uncharacterized protein LOC116122419 n=1 Tax=Pistacia vera TaxID=55513 RepID=UPI001262D428|nr:uncharacterized protein LOC116122419 [Pistacia vera]